MARYILKRFFLTLPALWLVLTLVFRMIHIVTGDPVEQMLSEGAAPGQLAQLAFLALVFVPRLPFLQECSPPIATVKPPAAVSEGVLVQND
jgi:ABC-type dipeptide/oligopeptide/nickel transport system permease component